MGAVAIAPSAGSGVKAQSMCVHALRAHGTCEEPPTCTTSSLHGHRLIVAKFPRAVACEGSDNWHCGGCLVSHGGQCTIPALPVGVTYVGRGEPIVVVVICCCSCVRFCLLIGSEVCRIEIDESDTYNDLRKAFARANQTCIGNFLVVLPDCKLLNNLCEDAISRLL